MITNDPWLGTGHLPDVTLVKPIFRNDRLVAFAGSTGHLPDIGGRIRSQDATELFEEGLRIPPIKFLERGAINPTLELLLRANVRVPDQVMGDLMAHLAAADTLERRLLAFMDEQALDELYPLSVAIQQRAERAMEAAIEMLLPPGEYTNEVRTDDLEEGPVVIRATVTVDGRRIHVDYDGTSSEVKRSLNVVLAYTFTYTAYALKCLLCPEIPNNEGSFQPITVTAPERCILNTHFPAPVGARAVIGHFLPEVLFGALARAIPNRVLAASGSPLWCLNFTGTGDGGRKFAGLFFLNGGMGASATGDGKSAISFPSNISSTPIETLENLFPLLIERKALISDSGGAGTFRGGCGQQLDVQFTTARPVTVAIMADRTQHPGAALQGGSPGAPGGVRLNGQTISAKDQRTVKAGQVITLCTPGGAGYGDPARRDRRQVRADVADGLVSTEAASRVYELAE